MGDSGSRSGRKQVFVSYAHGDDRFNEQVEQLVDDLKERGFVVISDFDHRVAAPTNGWTAWMQHGVEQADCVLIVCTPTMKDVFERRRDLPVRGATVESAYVIASLRRRLTHNQSIYPILPDGGTRDAVPVLLEEWFNNHRFNSGNARIAQLVEQSQVPSAARGAGPDEEGITAMKHDPEDAFERLFGQELVARDCLAADAVAPFLDALRGELDDSELTPCGVEWSVDRIVKWCGREVEPRFETVRTAMMLVRDALSVADEALANDAAPQLKVELFERAAVALYLLLATRLVVADGAADAVAGNRAHGHAPVPSEYPMFWGIVAAVLYGCRVEVRHVDGSIHDVPEGFIAIEIDGVEKTIDPADLINVFERELYAALFWDHPSSAEVAEGDKPLDPVHRKRLLNALSEAERGQLEARLYARRTSRREAPAIFVIRASADVRVKATDLNGSVQARTMFIVQQDDPAAKRILAVDPGRLEGHIREFLGHVKTRLSRPVSASSAGPRHSSGSGETGTPERASAPMVERERAPVVVTGDGNTVVIDSTGASSRSSPNKQVGDHNRIAVDTESIAALAKQLLEFARTIGDPEAARQLKADAVDLQAEASQEGLLKRSLDSIKSTLDGLMAVAEHSKKAKYLCGLVVTLLSKLS